MKRKGKAPIGAVQVWMKHAPPDKCIYFSSVGCFEITADGASPLSPILAIKSITGWAAQYERAIDALDKFSAAELRKRAE